MFQKEKLNLNIIIPIIILAVISVITIHSASVYISDSLGNLALKQSMWYIAGIILIFFIIKLKNDFFYQYVWVFYIIGNLSLLSLLFFAPRINQARIWFVIPGIGSVQPSEFIKVFLMVLLAVMIHKFKVQHKYPTIKEEFIFLVKTLIVVLIPSLLTFLQPDTGIVIIYFVTYLCMLFLSGIRLRWFIFFTSFLLFILFIVIYLYHFHENTFINIFGNDLFYRFERIFSWSSGVGIQLENSVAAIGSAGIIGHGFNQTPIYFPEAGTDFIFAVFASNFGLLGILFFLFVIVYFNIQLLLLIRKKIAFRDRYLLAGILGMLIFQQVQNIAMTVGLLPIMGITLPFISYGGSSLLSYLFMIGLVLNISIQKESLYQ